MDQSLQSLCCGTPRVIRTCDFTRPASCNSRLTSTSGSATDAMEGGVRPCKGLRATEDEFGNYDVFLSHRGPDTKTGFVGFLYEGLEAAGLRPFLDCECIEKGQDAWTCIEHAIKTTPIAVVIFSESFAQSEWCLRELHVMLDTPGVKVVPVFYRVQPCEVRFPEKGQLAAGFEKLQQRHDEALMEKWREDLSRASKLNGWEHKVGDRRLERDLVKEIVGKVLELANKPLPLDVGEHVIGVDRVAEGIIQTLDGNKRVLMLGLWGMGGIGKSTLARELYNRLRRRFAASCYVEDVTEKVIQGGVVKVQNCILKDLCTNESKKVKDKSKGKVILEDRLCKKQILLVLDDVRDNDEMYYWISHKMLTEGSMCIVTSRNRHVFEKSSSFDVNHEVHIHDVRGLSSLDSERVFASFSFGGASKVKRGFEELVVNISKACGGVPLVLKVCGALLKNEEDVEIWKDVLKKLNGGTIMDEERIFACLRISYDSLQGQYREMFLDIACALVGQSKDLAIRVWKSRGVCASLGVRSLIERALVMVDDDGCFHMHDHLRDMGREIVRKERSGDGVIRRLWMPESLTLLEGDEPLPLSLQTLIIYGGDDYFDRSPIDLDVSHMKDLHILICGYSINVRFSLPKNLSWFNYKPLRTNGVVDIFPKVPETNKLVILDLELHHIRTLRESIGNWSKLEVLNLGFTMNVSRLPYSFWGPKKLCDLNLGGFGIPSLLESFGELNNLEVLNMNSCEVLIFVPHSFGKLKKLHDLNLRGCGIQSLPESFGELSSLKVLNMDSCRELISLPQSFGNLKKLFDLNLRGCRIQSLPESFGELSNLELLNVGSCFALISLPHSFGNLKKLRDLQIVGCGIQSLPDSFGELRNLEVLNVGSCFALISLPHSFGNLKKLRDLQIVGCGIQSLPESFGELSNLKVLNMDSCRELISLPHSFGNLKKLFDLDLAWSGIQSLSESFGELSNLEVLNMKSCGEFISLPHSFGNLTKLWNLNLGGCGIQSLPESFGDLSNLKVLNMGFCRKFISLPHSFGNLKKLHNLFLVEVGIQSLPDSFGELSNLEVLNMGFCRKIISLPHSFGNLKKLCNLHLGGCGVQSLLESFGELNNLEVLNMDSCREFISLPQSFGNLKKLFDLNLQGCRIQSLPKSFGELSSLKVLNMDSCRELISLPQSFGNLKKLHDLKLGGCGIQSLPESFGDLSNLKVLNMDFCPKIISLPHSFGNLKKLRNLDLLCSGIQSLMESFGELSNLEVLNMDSCCKLISLPHSFGNLKKLRDLDLANAGIQNLPESFGKLSNLEVLNLKSCHELISLPNSIGNLKKLWDLDLEGCGIESLSESFGELSTHGSVEYDLIS